MVKVTGVQVQHQTQVHSSTALRLPLAVLHTIWTIWAALLQLESQKTAALAFKTVQFWN